jgi:hypothetical protein
MTERARFFAEAPLEVVRRPGCVGGGVASSGHVGGPEGDRHERQGNDQPSKPQLPTPDFGAELQPAKGSPSRRGLVARLPFGRRHRAGMVAPPSKHCMAIEYPMPVTHTIQAGTASSPSRPHHAMRAVVGASMGEGEGAIGPSLFWCRSGSRRCVSAVSSVPRNLHVLLERVLLGRAN